MTALPQTPARPPQRVKPRDAASLVLLRHGSDGPEVLMGRRHSRHAFIPDAFVFPGGKLDAEDRRIRTATNRTAPDAAQQALEAAAIRETFEETGLLLGTGGDIGQAARGTWQVFQQRGLVPDTRPLNLLARAITPAESPIRFHARFFVAENAPVEGTLAGSGELLDLDWYPLARALALPVIDVTEFVLQEVIRRSSAGSLQGPVAFWRYRRGTPVLTYED
ncbi:NUDIX hydrolase [Pyruvatibacter mobilis]|uniref:NUDIX hydrolase n=1 Tax=Pyruvatibacter mobilis TaxID=1712261 RepID=UPI003BAD32BB